LSTSSQNAATARLSLIDLADIEYAKCVAAVDVETDELADETRETFLAVARSNARNRLGATADELEWAYTPPVDLTEDVEEATAPLASGRSEYLRYRFNHTSEEASFALVQPCDACGESRIGEVADLVDLGRLLALSGGAA
jgi:hypothetical protein